MRGVCVWVWVWVGVGVCVCVCVCALHMLKHLACFKVQAYKFVTTTISCLSL